VIPLRRPRTRPAWLGLPAAAVVLLALGAAFLWRQLREGDAAGPATEYATGIGETERIRLADGSTVQLGPLTRLAVAGDYGRARREMRLQGEAFITAVHDPERPFVVRTAGAEVRDLGTAFGVRADSAATEVVVTEGAVAVRPAAGGAETVVHAGGRARVDGAGRVTAGAAPDAAAQTAWTEGRLVFHDAPLAEVAAAFRRWYGLVLVIPDAALAARRVTATLPTGAPEQALQVLAATAGARTEQRGDTVTVVPAR
jgi:transmembrane sensor